MTGMDMIKRKHSLRYQSIKNAATEKKKKDVSTQFERIIMVMGIFAAV